MNRNLQALILFTVVLLVASTLGHNSSGASEEPVQMLTETHADADQLVFLGWREFKLGNYLGAHAAFTRARERRYGAVDPLIGLGWTNFKLGNLDESEKLFLMAQSKTFLPIQALDVKEGLGWVALWRDDLQRAQEIFAEGVRQFPKAHRLDEALARVYLLEEKYEEALLLTRKGLELAHSESSLALLAAILEKRAAPDESVDVYADLVESRPDIASYWIGFGYNLLTIDRLSKAKKAFDIAQTIEPQNTLAKVGLAEVLTRMHESVSAGWTHYFDGDYEAALAVFEARDEESSRIGNPAAATGQGWSLLAMGRVKAAEEALQRALDLEPSFALAKEGIDALVDPHSTLYLQAWNLAIAGRYERAAQQFRRAAQFADAEQIWKTEDGHAWLTYFRKDLDEAEQSFKAILERWPDAYLSRTGLAYIALERGKYRRAEELLVDSISRKPDQVLTSYTLSAQRFIDAGRYATAVRVLELGRQAYPQSADIYFLLAMAYRKLNDIPGSVANAAKAVEQQPTYIHPAFDALEPHGMSRKRLAAFTEGAARPSADAIPPMTLAISRATLGSRGGEPLACMTCHQEHRGQDIDLKTISNQRCVTCHRAAFDSLSQGHPEFSEFPYARRTGIVFDHASHIAKHFTEAAVKDAAPGECKDCHMPDVTGRAMLVKGFQTTCAACHAAQIEGEGRATAKGVAVFNVPGLDVATLAEKGAAIGGWPEYPDGEITAFMDFLLARVEGYADTRKKVAYLDLLDLSEASDAEIAAVERFAWSVKGFYFDLATRGIAALKERFEATLDRKLTTGEVARLAGLLPADAIRASQRAWFPDLLAEIPRHRNGEAVPMPAPAAETEGNTPPANPEKHGAAEQDDGSILDDDDDDKDDGILGEDDDDDEDDGILGEDDDKGEDENGSGEE